MTIAEKIKQRVINNFFKTLSYPPKNAVDNLLKRHPFDYSPQWKQEFTLAMQCSFSHHRENSEFYKKLCSHKGFADHTINTFEDIWEIPFILTDVFKFHAIDTKTKDKLRTEFTSSGTSGRKSRIMIDIISGQRLLLSVYRTYKALGLTDDTPANYLMMSYNPDIDSSIGTTQSDVVISYLTPRKSVFYALDKGGNNEIGFIKDAAVEAVRRFVNEGLPVRILGFVHHACEAIKSYNEKYGRLILPPKSYLLTGGGWKAASNPYGEDFNLFTFIKERTNMDIRNVRDLYTLNEHAIFYLECEGHNMHIPNVALACVRDPRTLKRLPDGETGIIHLYSPFIESTPLLSVLTTDYGYIGRTCPCRTGGPYIKITGRAELTPKDTCAFMADKYVEKTKVEAVLAR